jgi:DNA-directed RNA polymerase subunit RPC12/RpoP
MAFIPCFLCGRKLETSKSWKPYFVCDPCGIQIFVRGKKGIELLDEAFRNIEKAQIPYSVRARHLHEIQALIKEVDGVNAEIDKLGISYYFNDEKLRIRNSLRAQRDNLLSQLERMAKKEAEQIAEP